MPSPYSIDLRERAMAHYEKYKNASLTSRVFRISRSIIYNWKKLQKSQGDLAPKQGYQKGYGHKIKDLEQFRNLVETNPGLTLKGLIKKSNLAISAMTCSRALKKLKITRKKDIWL
jgi:transposase